MLGMTEPSYVTSRQSRRKRSHSRRNSTQAHKQNSIIAELSELTECSRNQSNSRCTDRSISSCMSNRISHKMKIHNRKFCIATSNNEIVIELSGMRCSAIRFTYSGSKSPSTLLNCSNLRRAISEFKVTFVNNQRNEVEQRFGMER